MRFTAEGRRAMAVEVWLRRALPSLPCFLPILHASRCSEQPLPRLQHGAHGEMTRRNQHEQEERSSTPWAMSVLGTRGPVKASDVLGGAG